MGTLVHLSGGRVKATGVVGQYPLNGMHGTFVDWVLYRRLGSTTTSHSVIGSLVPPRTANQTAPYALYDGQLVTVEGTLSPPRPSHFVSSPWSQLAVASISTAPPEAQARVPWKGSLITPGRWFDVPWRRSLAQMYEEVMGPNSYPDVARASKAFGAPIPAPHTSLTGRLIGVTVNELDHSKREWYQFYFRGIVIGGPFHTEQGGPASIALLVKSERDSHQPTPRLVRIHGQPGIIMSPGKPLKSLWFWDGKGDVSIGPGPPDLTDDDLLAIARSMTR